MRAEDDESSEGEGYAEGEHNAAVEDAQDTEDVGGGKMYRGCGARQMAEVANYLSPTVHEDSRQP
jgi:hypothetical protein